MIIFKTYTFFLLFFEVQGSIFFFDLSAIENEKIDKPNILQCNTPARLIGVTPEEAALNFKRTEKENSSSSDNKIVARNIPACDNRIEIIQKKDTEAIQKKDTGVIQRNVEHPVKTIGIKRTFIGVKKEWGTKITFICRSFEPATDNLISNINRNEKGVPITVLDPQLSPDQIIENELNFNAVNFANIDQKNELRKYMKLISEHDYSMLSSTENQFTKVFNITKSSTFEKNGIKNYLLIPAIIFGAWDIHRHTSIHYKSIKTLHEIIDILLAYLITTKPTDIVIKTILNLFPVSMEDKMREDVISLIKKRNPNMNFYQKVCVKFIGLGYKPPIPKLNISGVLDNDKSDIMKLEIIANSFTKTLSHFPEIIEDYQKIPLKFQEAYMALSAKSKFEFLKLSLINDDLEVFQSILNLDPEIILYYDENNEKQTFFNAAIENKAKNCFEMILDTFPEFNNSFELSPIKAALDQFNRDFLTILEERNSIDPTLVLHFANNQETITLLEHLLTKRYHAGREYIAPKVNYEVLKRILNNPKSHGHTEQSVFLYRLLKYISYDAFIDAVKILKIDLNIQTFRLTDIEGNGAIFWAGNKNIIEECQKLNISTTGTYYIYYDYNINGLRVEKDINFVKNHLIWLI